MATRGERNNNPGNLRYNSSVDWVGQTGSDGSFAQFDTPEHGYRAMSLLLIRYQEKHGLGSLNEIISKYAPSSENDTTAYVQNVSQQTGLGANQEVNLRENPELLAKVAFAMTKVENGPNTTYTFEQARAGVQMAVGDYQPGQSPADLSQASAAAAKEGKDERDLMGDSTQKLFSGDSGILGIFVLALLAMSQMQPQQQQAQAQGADGGFQTVPYQPDVTGASHSGSPLPDNCWGTGGNRYEVSETSLPDRAPSRHEGSKLPSWVPNCWGGGRS